MSKPFFVLWSAKKSSKKRRVLSRVTKAARINKRSKGAREAVYRSIRAQALASKLGIKGTRISQAVLRGIAQGRRNPTKTCRKCLGTGVTYHPADMKKIGKLYVFPKHSWRRIPCPKCRRNPVAELTRDDLKWLRQKYVNGTDKVRQQMRKVIEAALDRRGGQDSGRMQAKSNPLKKGSSRATVSANIRKLMREGKSRKQAVAIALKTARLSKKRLL